MRGIFAGAALWTLTVALSATVFTPVHAASGCPEFGVSEKAQASFCAELLKILYAPAAPSRDRGSEQGDRQSQKLRDLLGSDPLWAEAYRSDPKRTLELIARIRGAGGLQR
ncbi:MAG: hypothetical protein AAGI50_16915 [Pseudomonadota bacterium]